MKRLIALTVCEARRLWRLFFDTVIMDVGFILSWSHWRRRHQYIARECHYRRRKARQKQRRKKRE